MPAGLSRPWRRAQLALLAAGVAALLGAATDARATGATTRLTNDVVTNLNLATLVGPVAASQPVTVGVFLNNPNQAAEDAYAKQLYDPSSPNYQNFLDADQFALQFGVPSATADAAQAWLTGAGLSVSRPEGSTQYLLATGTAARSAPPSAYRSTTTRPTGGTSTRMRRRRRFPRRSMSRTCSASTT